MVRTLTRPLILLSVKTLTVKTLDMADTQTCSSCKGSGTREYLVSQHGYETETGKCNDCNGTGKIHYMSDEDEQDYWENYW